MSDPAQLERVLTAVLDRFSDGFKELIREVRSTAAAPVAAAPAGPGTSELCAGFEHIVSAGNQTEVMQALLDAASAFASRSAIMVVKGDKLGAWRSAGFTEAAQAGLRNLAINQDGDGGWRQAALASGPLSRALAQNFFSAAGSPADGRAYLIPLVVRERPVAMLYADGGTEKRVDDSALALLARSAGMRLEVASARPRAEAAVAAAAAAPAPEPPPAVAAPPPPSPAPEPEVQAPPGRPARATGPDLTNVPAADHDIHKKAFRFAKLLVDELVLYNKDKVAEGKRNRNVYGVLQEDIDKSRLAYEKKFSSTAAGKADYFYQQMVALLGDGDSGVLGSGYPGPQA